MNIYPTWLTLEETADYLNIGKTRLYELARQGLIPVQRVGKKWTFEKDAVDEWVRSHHSMKHIFLNLDFKIENNPYLREPQHDAYLRVADFFRSGKNKAIVQIPVGCGKTGLAALLPFGISQGRVIIIAPNLTIKNGLYDAMDITNRQRCFWHRAAVLDRNQMASGPFACTLDTGNLSVAEKSHVVITNVQQLATNEDKWLTQFPNDFFDMIVVDEAHHSAASSWQKVINRFPTAKVVLLTATPFRSDRVEIDGESIYRYPFRSAMLKGYIKRLKSSYVVPSQIELEFKDARGRIYSQEEVLKLKEEEWFSRGVALSRPCNLHIVENSLEKLEELRQSGTRHQLIAVACSINHAREVRSLYTERGFNADVIHSHQNTEEREGILNSLYNGTLDCIVQVQMLGEGFDHPKLSVAAIFRPFRSLAPYIQFVGRIMRVVVQNNPTHPDNLGHIVTHIGMNLDERLREFQKFENDDHAFWEKVIGANDTELSLAVLSGNARLTTNEPVVVSDEIVDSLWEEELLALENEEIVKELQEKFALLGLDPSHAEEIVKRESTDAHQHKRSPAEPFVVQPQREWKEARRRLNEQAKRIAKIILNNVSLDTHGTELTFKYKSLKVSGRNNFVSAFTMVNHEINKRLGKDRSEASTEEFKKICSELDDILQMLVRRVHAAINEYEQTQA